MSGVQIRAVGPEDAELRLDRWFKRHFPGLGHGRLEKLLRTGQVRIDGKRARAGDRLSTGQNIRVPPLEEWAGGPPRPMPPGQPRDSDLAALRAAVLYRDDDVIVINKPAGLAVQGGTGTVHHLDGLLDALRFEASERPRLVHRLDKDTSGVLMLARSAAAAATLADAFRSKTARKVYWTIVVGLPLPRQGKIDMPLAKLPGRGGEKMAPEDDGKSAVTYYNVIENAGDKASLLAERVKAATGRDFAIAGRLDLKLSLTPTLAVSDLRLANPPGFSRPDMATIAKLEGQIALWPLLSGRVQIERFALNGADIVLETNAQGRGNWVFETIAATPAPASESGRSLTLAIGALTIGDSALTYRDGHSGAERRLALGKATLRESGDGGALDIALQGAVDAMPFDIVGKTGGIAPLLA